jgi:pimeloyl-ACP methyl ester carboxylesterase
VPVGPHRLLRRIGVLVALLAVLAAPACSVGPSDRPAVAVRDAGLPPQRPPAPSTTALPPPPRGEYDTSSLPWQDCTTVTSRQLGAPSPARVDCTQLQVDADVSMPAFGDTLELDLNRIGRGPAPLVVVGEPGGEPGTVRAARLAGQLPPELLNAYTLVGLARRGTGPSEPLDCVPTSTRNQIVGVDPAVPSPAQLDTLLDVTRTAIQTCVQDLGEVLTAINSTGTADDLEALRVALRAPVLNVISEGSASRAVTDFARRYPTSVGRIVLDGAADPTLDGVTEAEANLAATEAGYDAFAADCVAKGCPLAPDPRAALRAATDALYRRPTQVGNLVITPGTAYQAVLETIGTPERWGALAEALSAARTGDNAKLAALVAPVIVPTEGLPARFDPDLATHCNDTSTRVPPERAKRLVDQWRQRSPMFGPMFAQRLLLCSAWPVPSAPPEGPEQRGLPPVLVVATAGDPVTPQEGARRTADSIPSATLTTWQGRAHGALPRSSCVVGVATRFLVDGVTPAPDTLCPP